MLLAHETRIKRTTVYCLLLDESLKWPETAPLPSRINRDRVRRNARRFWKVNAIRRSHIEAKMFAQWPKMARCGHCGTLLPTRDACHYCVN